MKSAIRNLLYRYDGLRFAASAVWNALHPATRYQVDHLTFYREEGATGPLQRDEALLLFGLTKVLRPQVIVEFGFHYGHSAFNFLQAAPRNCKLYSYDIDDTAEQISRDRRFQRFQNFHFIRKSQTEFSAADIGNQKIDLCFLDASHDFELNQVTFKKLESSLSDGAIIAVHDTGTWVKQFLGPAHKHTATAMPQWWINEVEFQPCPGEREFVNWILTSCPGFCEIHLHTISSWLHGSMTSFVMHGMHQVIRTKGLIIFKLLLNIV